MLSLASTRWRELTQAYGTAEVVPRLLEALGNVPDDRARVELWFALSRMLHLVTLIETDRRSPSSVPTPDDLLEDYASAIERIPALVAAMIGDPWPDDVARILTAALLAGKHHVTLARVLLSDDHD